MKGGYLHMLLSHFFQNMFQFWEGAPVLGGGWPAADGGRGAACCYNYTPHSGASSPLLHTKHSHSVIQYQGVQGTCIPALQALSLNTFDQIDSITYDL